MDVRRPRVARSAAVPSSVPGWCKAPLACPWSGPAAPRPRCPCASSSPARCSRSCPVQARSHTQRSVWSAAQAITSSVSARARAYICWSASSLDCCVNDAPRPLVAPLRRRRHGTCARATSSEGRSLPTARPSTSRPYLTRPPPELMRSSMSSFTDRLRSAAAPGSSSGSVRPSRSALMPASRLRYFCSARASARRALCGGGQAARYRCDAPVSHGRGSASRGRPQHVRNHLGRVLLRGRGAGRARLVAGSRARGRGRRRRRPLVAAVAPLPLTNVAAVTRRLEHHRLGRRGGLARGGARRVRLVGRHAALHQPNAEAREKLTPGLQLLRDVRLSRFRGRPASPSPSPPSPPSPSPPCSAKALGHGLQCLLPSPNPKKSYP